MAQSSRVLESGTKDSKYRIQGCEEWKILNQDGELDGTPDFLLRMVR